MKKNSYQQSSLPYNKANFQMWEQERNMLKITLQHINVENNKWKHEWEDIKVTARQNKELLREYVNQITNKDKVFDKMTAQIEQLTNRWKVWENYKKLNIAADVLKKAHKIKDNSSSPINLNSNTNVNQNPNLNNHSTLATTTTNPQGNVRDKSQSQQRNINSIINTSLKNQDNYSNTNTNNTNPNNNTPTNSSNKINTNAINNSIYKGNKTNSNLNIKDFYTRQSALIEEMSSLKDDIQFLLENKTKSKWKDKWNQSINSTLNYVSSNNSWNNTSIIYNSAGNSVRNSSNNNITNNNQMNSSVIHNTSYISNSSLNNSIISNISTNTVRKKINIKDRYFIDDNWTEFLGNYNKSKNILFLIDNKGVVWEWIRRLDLTMSYIVNNPTNLKSVVCWDKADDKLYNIEIKDPFENRSIVNSEEDVGKFSDFNLSKYVKENECENEIIKTSNKGCYVNNKNIQSKVSKIK